MEHIGRGHRQDFPDAGEVSETYSVKRGEHVKVTLIRGSSPDIGLHIALKLNKKHDYTGIPLLRFLGTVPQLMG